MGTAPETTIRPSPAFAHMFSTRDSWLDYFKYAVKYSRHDWVTVDGLPTLCRPGDDNASVVRDHLLETPVRGVLCSKSQGLLPLPGWCGCDAREHIGVASGRIV
jgi:hypothetical protein